MPCIATLGWDPACPAKHTEPQGSAGTDSSKAPAISVVCSTGKKSGGGDLHGDLCASPLHSFGKGEEVSQQSLHRAAETGGELDCVAQAPRAASLGSGTGSVQAHSLSCAGWKGEVALAAFQRETGDEMCRNTYSTGTNGETGE